ncbi:hypothetical protein [Bradyrhizobium lupini]|uniref:hypothetical protein n=1 Tax=Rhizobium lupini TaxID=136996 RepID=UPI0034C62108
MSKVEWNDGFPDFLPPQTKGGLTGQRRYVRVMPWSVLLPQDMLALQVEYSVFDHGEGRWTTAWRYATPDDVSEEVITR